MTDNAPEKAGEAKKDDIRAEAKPAAVDQLADVGDVSDPDEDDLDDLDGTFAPFCLPRRHRVLLTLS